MKKILEFLNKHNVLGFQSRLVWKSVVATIIYIVAIATGLYFLFKFSIVLGLVLIGAMILGIIVSIIVSKFKTIKKTFQAKKILKYVLATILALVLLTGVAFGAVKGSEYSKVNNLIEEATQLASEEKYDEAITKLELTQDKWTTKNIRERINTKIELNKCLASDKKNFDEGISKFNEQKYQEAKDLLAKVSESYSKYSDAQNKIKESDTKIAEKNEADQKAKEEEEKNKSSIKTASSSTYNTKNTPISSNENVNNQNNPSNNTQPQPENNDQNQFNELIKLYVDIAIAKNSEMDSIFAQAEKFSELDIQEARAKGVKSFVNDFSPPDGCYELRNRLIARADNLINFAQAQEGLYRDIYNRIDYMDSRYFPLAQQYSELQAGRKSLIESEISRLKSKYGL